VVDRVVDAGGDRLAGALAVVAEPAAPAAQAEGAAQLADERVPFGGGPGGPFEVVGCSFLRLTRRAPDPM
jgi:hypothetical protein